MKKIYWCLQQINNIGGTEMVTLQIIRLLSNDYEIHLIPFDKVDKEHIIYDIPSNVVIEDVGFPAQISQFDFHFYKYWNNKHYIKAIKLLFKQVYIYTFGRFKYRKNLEKMTTKDDILIFPSNELMCFAPKNRYKIQHFHFNSKLYFNIFSKTLRRLSKKPDHIVFLTDATKNNVDKKNKFKSTVIPNPSRFKRKENFEYHNNTLITACRFENQKNPMMLVKIAKELKDMNFSYTFNIYGSGTYKKEMEDYIKTYSLDNVHLISGVTNLESCYLNSDLYVITSRFEGFPLSVIEANSLSVPTIWKEMSDPTSSCVFNDVNGYIIDSENPKDFAKKIVEVLSDKDKLRKLKESTYNLASKYEEENIKKIWLDFFKQQFNLLDKKN